MPQAIGHVFQGLLIGFAGVGGKGRDELAVGIEVRQRAPKGATEGVELCLAGAIVAIVLAAAVVIDDLKQRSGVPAFGWQTSARVQRPREHGFQRGTSAGPHLTKTARRTRSRGSAIC